MTAVAVAISNHCRGLPSSAHLRLRMNGRHFPSVSFGEIELTSGGMTEFGEIQAAILMLPDGGEFRGA